MGAVNYLAFQRSLDSVSPRKASIAALNCAGCSMNGLKLGGDASIYPYTRAVRHDIFHAFAPRITGRSAIGARDLSDLRANFERNMRQLALWEHLTLLDMPNDVAVTHLSERTVRFLFVDGDHTHEGVTKDIRLFFPLLLPGAIVVFDDFAARFPGVVEAADALLDRTPVSRAFSYANTLVLML